MWRCGSRRAKTEIARASRSDTHSDWSTTLGANYTYRLYLQYVWLCCLPTMHLFASLLTVQRSSPTFSRLQGLSVQPQNCVLDLVPLFPVDSARRTFQRLLFSPRSKENNKLRCFRQELRLRLVRNSGGVQLLQHRRQP